MVFMFKKKMLAALVHVCVMPNSTCTSEVKNRMNMLSTCLSFLVCDASFIILALASPCNNRGTDSTTQV